MCANWEVQGRFQPLAVIGSCDTGHVSFKQAWQLRWVSGLMPEATILLIRRLQNPTERWCARVSVGADARPNERPACCITWLSELPCSCTTPVNNMKAIAKNRYWDRYCSSYREVPSTGGIRRVMISHTSTCLILFQQKQVCSSYSVDR